MNFLFGGAENDPIKEKSYKVKDLVKFHGLSVSWTVLERFNTKSRESWSLINSFQDTIKNRRLNNLSELVDRLQPPYSGRSSSRPISEAIKIYKDKEYAKKKYGIVGNSFDALLDLEKIKEDLVNADNVNEEVLEELADAGYEERDVIPSIKNKSLYGEEWLKEVDQKISDKMNSFTSKLFDLDIWDFNETINAYRESGEFGSMSSNSRSSSSSRSRSSRRSRRRSRSRSRRRSRSRSTRSSRQTGQSGSDLSLSTISRRSSRSRSRSRSRPRSVSSDDLPLVGRRQNRPVARRLFD